MNAGNQGQPGAEARIDAVEALLVAEIREGVGRHELDGAIQDLSPDAVTSGLAALGGPTLSDPHDEAHLACYEDGLRWLYGEYQAHRRDPLLHLFGLDLAGYDRAYAPEPERAAARERHLANWPDAMDVAVSTLDLVPAPTAAALLPAVKGLADGLRGGDGTPPAASGPVLEAALAAHARLVAHIEQLAEHGDPDCSVGAPMLAAAMGSFEAITVDLTALAEQADVERDRLRAVLEEACGRLRPGVPARELVEELVGDHPDVDGVLAEARAITEEVIAFTDEHKLAPWNDGECLVVPSPPSRRWALAMMAWSGPAEPDTPSFYYVTPPDPTWPADEIESWLAVFSRTSLPAITVHEVAPGHYSHGRALRRAPSRVRRELQSPTFSEGWAHYVEETVVEVGFRPDDPRYVIGMAIEALVRVTRLACAIGLHTGGLDVAGATARFTADAFLTGPAARAEAERGTFDIGYGRYTLGKLAIRELRERARARWGADFSLPRLHSALMDLGAPPIGLIGTALERG